MATDVHDKHAGEASPADMRLIDCQIAERKHTEHIERDTSQDGTRVAFIVNESEADKEDLTTCKAGEAWCDSERQQDVGDTEENSVEKDGKLPAIEGGWGWAVVLGCFLMHMLIGGWNR